MSQWEKDRLIHYDQLLERLVAAKSKQPQMTINTPLTLTEKIIFSHLDDPSQAVVRGKTFLQLRPDRLAMQDASAQTAILQYMLTERTKTAAPASIHCDHLIVADKGASLDVAASWKDSGEVYDFLKSASQRFGIGFWQPGAGIIHQIVLENYAFPGGLMIGTDSHTPNAGGLNMIAIGVGGADAVDVMAGIPWELKAPQILGVKLVGKLNGWASEKDVILYLAGKLTVKGGTGYVIEYFGEGVESLSCTGMATICNMGAEVGATTSIFPFVKNAHVPYLNATGRSDIAAVASNFATSLLVADENAKYDDVIEIDLSKLEPFANGPFTPDRATPVSKLTAEAIASNWPIDISAALIGSCTNSSYGDMARAANIVKQALDHGLTKTRAKLYITPGSEQIRGTIERDGIVDTFKRVGGEVLANACGPCIGQWNRKDETTNGNNKKANTIVSSYNRNFTARNDGNAKTHNFLCSPEFVTAMAFSGKLGFDPSKDSLTNDKGESFKFSPPVEPVLPPNGFSKSNNGGDGNSGYLEPPSDGSKITVTVSPKSDRLQLLQQFDEFSRNNFEKMRVLVKVKGKCTTDHISAAGVWLKYKGHLENISENTLIGAINADFDKANVAVNGITKKQDTIPETAKYYKKNGINWVVVGEWNYGEGSAREHASMQPRFLGGRAIIVKSFARIHETNLKKQGMLPLTFKDPNDYDKISSDDLISITNIDKISPNEPLLTLRVEKSNNNFVIDIPVLHTMNEQQLLWFKTGSAMNYIRNQGR